MIGWRLSDLPCELERKLGAEPQAFVDPAGYRAGMVRSERCVARIEVPLHNPLATGFLVSPNLLITNQHVRADPQRNFDRNPGLVRFRFGYVEEDAASSVVHELDEANWLVAESDALDYCVVRLRDEPGNRRIGSASLAPLRGWITPHGDDTAIDGQTLSILQHPLGEPLKFARGQLSNAGSARATGWIDYKVNTDRGSSGSPVFDTLWRCVALHSRAGQGDNRGVHFHKILNSFTQKLRDELRPFSPEHEGNAVAEAGAPGTLVDTSGLSIAQLQQVGRGLLLAQANESLIDLGSGGCLVVVLSDAAKNPAQRLGLKGDLDVLQTQLLVLQEHQQNLAIDPVGALARRTLIARQEEQMLKTVDGVRERVMLMTRERRLRRA